MNKVVLILDKVVYVGRIIIFFLIFELFMSGKFFFSVKE